MSAAPNNSAPATAANRNAADWEPNEQTQTQPENERDDGRTAETPTPKRRATETTSPANGAGQPTKEETTTKATNETTRPRNPSHFDNPEGVKGGGNKNKKSEATLFHHSRSP